MHVYLGGASGYFMGFQRYSLSDEAERPRRPEAGRRRTEAEEIERASC